MAIKQVIVVRTDLDMGKGKIAAQVGHACVMGAEHVRKSNPEWFSRWWDGQEKVVLKVVNLKELEEIKRNLRNQRDSTDAVKKRLQDVLIQLSLPSSGDDSRLAENEKKRLSQEGDRIIASVRVGDFSWTKTPQDGIWVSSPGNWSPADPEAARVIGDYMTPH